MTLAAFCAGLIAGLVCGCLVAAVGVEHERKHADGLARDCREHMKIAHVWRQAALEARRDADRMETWNGLLARKFHGQPDDARGLLRTWDEIRGLPETRDR